MADLQPLSRQSVVFVELQHALFRTRTLALALTRIQALTLAQTLTVALTLTLTLTLNPALALTLTRQQTYNLLVDKAWCWWSFSMHFPKPYP